MSNKIALPALFLLVITIFPVTTNPAFNAIQPNTKTINTTIPANTTPPTLLGATAAFTYNPCVMCAVPGDYVFYDASYSKSPYGPITLYQWNFGDNTPPQNTTSPTTGHDYFGIPNKWTVTLTVTDSTKHTDTISQYVIFEVHPVFTYQPTIPQPNQPVLFNATGSTSYNSTSPITGYLWTFGDGTTGTGATIKHTYTTTGLYRTTLTLFTSDGNPQVSETIIVANIITSPPPRIFSDIFDNINITITGTINYDSTTHTLTASLGITATNVTTGQILYMKNLNLTKTYPENKDNPRFILAIPLSTISLGVLCTYHTDTATTTCMITKNPDLDGCATVDLQDVSTVEYDFGATPGTARWDPNADLAGDNTIDLIDVSISVASFGTPVFT